jgi:hypothetical protein
MVLEPKFFYEKLKKDFGLEHSAKMKGRTPWNKGYKETRPDVLKNIQNGVDSRIKYSGLKNPAAIKTIYEFIHKDGRIEVCTPYELRVKYNLSQSQTSQVINGTCKSVKGWRLNSSS